MIWLVLAESALELVPETIKNHPSVVSDIHRKNTIITKLLLDTNYHHSAMATLENAEQRGRPDIVHFCMLSAMNTPLNTLFGALRVAIHIKYPSERIIIVDPKTRIPRSLNRFEGLMATVLGTSKVPDAEAPGFFTTEDIALEKFLDNLDPVQVHVFSTTGTQGSFDQYLPGIGEEAMSEKNNIVLLIGGFQAGHFSGKWLSRVPKDHVHSIAPIPLDAWTVVARLVFMIEKATMAAFKNPRCNLQTNNHEINDPGRG
nr:hypothetical protein [Candidatus Sigynarchaeota archaeon]